MIRSHVAACSWSHDFDDFGVRVVPGGAWAIAAMLRDEPKPSYQLPPFTPISVPAFPSAIGACTASNGCVAYIEAGGSLVSVWGPQKGFPGRAAKLARAVVAAG